MANADQAYIIDTMGKPTRTDTFDWPAPPEDTGKF